MKNDVRKMTDGAMMAAIMGVVLLIDRQTAGLLQATILFLYPLPMVFFSVKYGWKSSWMVFVAIILLAAVIDTPATVINVAAEAFIGMLYGCGVYHKTDMKRVLLRTIAVSVISQVLITIIFAGFFGYDLLAEAKELEAMYSQMLTSMGTVLPTGVDMEQMILIALIVAVVLTGILQVLVLHMIAKLMFKRMHITIPTSIPLVTYEPPKWTGYVALAGVVGMFYAMSQSDMNRAFKMSLQGIGICGAFYLLFFGMMAVVLYCGLHKDGTRFLVMLIAIFLLFTAWVLFAILGFLYVTTDMHYRMMQRRFSE